MIKMKIIHLTVLYVTFHLTNEAKGTSIWKTLLAPDYPPLHRVRSLNLARGQDDFAILDFIGLVEQHSYPAEEHKLITEDGYQLTFHRIPDSPRANKTNKDKKVVYLQHGILASSDLWVLLGPGKDLSFLLADAGYDVWIGNIRGNSYCRSHEKLSTSDRDFWEFSYHEAAVYDVSSIIDYILNYTKKEKLYYIGHSMGTTMSYVLLSMKPEYNEKIHLAISLAPVALWTHGVSPIINLMVQNRNILIDFFNRNEIRDIGAQNTINIVVLRNLCSDASPLQGFCAAVITSLVGTNNGQLNVSTLPKLFSHYPAGTSVRTIDHYYQNMVTRSFRAYDYGYIGNYIRYKQKVPPTYDFKRITAPFLLFYGISDAVSLPENSIELYRHLPNASLEQVQNVWFNHFDFLQGIDAKTLIFDRALEVLDKF